MWQSAISSIAHIFLFYPWDDCDSILLLDALWLVGVVCVVLANGFRAEMTCASLEHLY